VNTRRWTAGLLCALWVMGCGSASEDRAGGDSGDAAAAPNTLTEREKADGWILLFDGVSTDGWRGYGRDDFPAGGWKAENGELVGTSSDGSMDGGDIITTGDFSDFELVFDFRVGTEGNSGVFYRVKEADGKGLWQVAAEYQVLDDPAYIAMGTVDMTTHLTGDNYDLQAAPIRPGHPKGEWNTGRIVVRGNHVEHWLNGQKMVEYDFFSDEWEALVAKSKFAEEEHYGRAVSGAIGLQDHGTPVWYRNIKIRPLEAVSLFNGRDLTGWTVHGTELWYVDGGDLVCESGPDAQYGYLLTDGSYGDFDLSVDFKQEANGNSGVFFRSQIEGVKISGWQAEVAPPGLFSGGIYESYGRGWLIQPPPEKDAALRMGEWNTLRVRAVGPRVTTWLNGTEMVDLTDEKIGAANGHIALQIHDGGGIRVRWRNLKIVDLDGGAGA
jgi:3-keto-disaccharide hydrolase